MAELVRIEDFIALAMEGKKVDASIELRKKLVSEKVHPGTFNTMKGEVDMYLLFGDYTFSVGNPQDPGRLLLGKPPLLPSSVNLLESHLPDLL